MISIRPIDERELGWFVSLSGMRDEALERQLRGMWADASSRPEWSLVAKVDGTPVGRVALAAQPLGGGINEPELRLVAAWIDWRHPASSETARDLLGACDLIAEQLRPTVIDRRLNAEVHDDIPAWRSVLEENGYELFQEKQGYLWIDSGEALPSADRVSVHSLSEVGRDRFLDVMAATAAGTLDRNDRYYIARCTPRPWADEILRFVEPANEPSTLLTFDGDDPVGFVALGAFDEERTATIVHIGVVPERRGRGYVDDLLRVANHAARERGYRSILSDVDTTNRPMHDAMVRNGHHPGRRPWHVWHYRRWVGAERQAVAYESRDHAVDEDRAG